MSRSSSTDVGQRPRPASVRRQTFSRLVRGAGVALPLLLAPAVGALADEPRPPCGTAPAPAYAEPGSVPAVRVWSGDELGSDWSPPACTGWDRSPLRVLVAAAGRFRYQGDAAGLLARFGAVSSLATVRYWSTSDRRWQGLITRAAALDGPDPDRRRPDFAAAELAGGADRYFAQDDNRSTGEVVYRMRVREFGPDRVVVEVENVGPVRYLLLPLAGPGDLRSLYFLERRSAAEWGCYSLSRTGAGVSRLAGGHPASYVNRAVALFRHLAGLRSDQEPPAAR